MGSYAVTLVVVAQGALALVGCGGKSPPPAPTSTVKVEAPPPKPATPAELEAKRVAAAQAIVPDGSTCVPAALKDNKAVRLELGADGSAALVCAVDADASRALGTIGCWSVDLSKPTGGLTYTGVDPLPGHDVTVALAGRCALGLCLPDDVKLGDAKSVHLALSFGGTQAVMLVDDTVHVFDVATKQHLSSFSVHGDKGVAGTPLAIYAIDQTVFVQAGDTASAGAVWMFASDGTAKGAITPIGKTDPVAVPVGSFAVLDKKSVGLAERGFEVLHTYEVATGKRAKLVRKVAKTSCKPTEIDAYWTGGDKVTDKCREGMDKNYAHLTGASVVAGQTNFLVMLRGDRLGELVVLDAKSLAEKKSIKLPWCS